MDADLNRFETAIGQMEAALARLESRMARVERRLAIPADDAPAALPQMASPAPSPYPPPKSRVSFQSIVSFIGRSLIVIGGAYLLRALAESGAFPVVIGAFAGLCYAAIFIVQTARQAHELRVSATFHAATATIIAMPLAVETALRFDIIPPEASFVVILGISGIVGAVAVRARLEVLAWIVEVVALASIVILMIGAHAFTFGMASLLVLSIGSVVVANRLESPSFILLPALFSTFLVVPLVDLSMSGKTLPTAATGIIAILAYVATWAAIVMTVSHQRSERPGPLLLAHLAIVTLLGVGGGFIVARRTGSELVFAIVCSLIALGSGSYALRTMIRLGDRDRRSVAFVTFTSILVMAVTAVVLSPARVAVLWLGLAAVSFLLARFGHRLLYEPATILTAGAAVMSGLWAWIIRSVIAVPSPAHSAPSGTAMMVVLASLIFLMTAAPPQGWRNFNRWTMNLVMSLIVVGSFIAIGVRLTQFALPMIGAGMYEPGAVAAARTIVLSLATIVLAWLARYPRSRTVGSMVNVILILTAVLIILVNVRVGRAATHFPAFSAYGIALIVAPALKRKSLSARNRSGDRPDLQSERDENQDDHEEGYEQSSATVPELLE